MKKFCRMACEADDLIEMRVKIPQASLSDRGHPIRRFRIMLCHFELATELGST